MFCTHCGREIDNGVAACPFCGEVVQPVEQPTDEQRLGVWHTYASLSGYPLQEIPCDLYLTANRLVAVRTGLGMPPASARMGGLVGIVRTVTTVEAMRKYEKERQAMENSTLDQMLSLDKSNVQVKHSDVKSMRLTSQLGLSFTVKELIVDYFKDGDPQKLRQMKFVLKKGEYDSLKSVLQGIDALSGKVQGADSA